MLFVGRHSTSATEALWTQYRSRLAGRCFCFTASSIHSFCAALNARGTNGLIQKCVCNKSNYIICQKLFRAGFVLSLMLYYITRAIIMPPGRHMKIFEQQNNKTHAVGRSIDWLECVVDCWLLKNAKEARHREYRCRLKWIIMMDNFELTNVAESTMNVVSYGGLLFWVILLQSKVGTVWI